MSRDGTSRGQLLDLTSGLPGANEILGYVDLRGIQFNGEIFGLELERIDMSYVRSLEGRQVENPFINLKRCSIRSSRFNHVTTPLVISVSDAQGSELIGTNLRRNIFRGSGVAGCRFDEAKLMRSDFVGCDLTGCSFRDADLTDATFMGAKYSSADFSDAKLRGTLSMKASRRRQPRLTKPQPFAK